MVNRLGAILLNPGDIPLRTIFRRRADGIKPFSSSVTREIMKVLLGLAPPVSAEELAAAEIE